MLKDELKLKCLELAAARQGEPAVCVVGRAQAYFNFVTAPSLVEASTPEKLQA